MEHKLQFGSKGKNAKVSKSNKANFSVQIRICSMFVSGNLYAMRYPISNLFYEVYKLSFPQISEKINIKLVTVFPIKNRTS